MSNHKNLLMAFQRVTSTIVKPYDRCAGHTNSPKCIVGYLRTNFRPTELISFKIPRQIGTTMKPIITALALLAIAGPACAGCTAGGLCVDSSGNVFTISPQGNIQGFNSQTGQQFTGTQFGNGVTIITPAPQGLPPLPPIGVQK